MPTKTFVDNSLVLWEEIILIMQMFKKIFLNPIAAILELAGIDILKRKIRYGIHLALLSAYR